MHQGSIDALENEHVAAVMIRPGLQRISGLLQGIDLSWKAIHVAGTNGKGSVCAYLSAMLHKANIRTGRFTSPHIIDRWDCISIDENPVSEALFREIEDRVQLRNERNGIGATNFEVLTAIAFEVFNHERVNVGIVECGMGGRLDSTNVLSQPLVTIISRIGKDHEAFLGDTLEKIASEKAGIFKKGSPAVVESENDLSALNKIQTIANDLGVDLTLTPPSSSDSQLLKLLSRSAEARSPSPTQLRNMWLAYAAMNVVLPVLGRSQEDLKTLAPAMAKAGLPGRNQVVSLQGVWDRKSPALLDGAHNAQALQQLSDYLETTSLASANGPRTWLIGCSQNKEGIFSGAITDQDNVVITEFQPVDGMPWVIPTPVAKVVPERQDSITKPVTARQPDLFKALEQACSVAQEGPLIIAGSLYLASDVLRALAKLGSSANPRSTIHDITNTRE